MKSRQKGRGIYLELGRWMPGDFSGRCARCFPVPPAVCGGRPGFPAVGGKERRVSPPFPGRGRAGGRLFLDAAAPGGVSLFIPFCLVEDSGVEVYAGAGGLRACPNFHQLAIPLLGSGTNLTLSYSPYNSYCRCIKD